MDNKLIVFPCLASMLFSVGVADAQQPTKVPRIGHLSSGGSTS